MKSNSQINNRRNNVNNKRGRGRGRTRSNLNSRPIRRDTVVRGSRFVRDGGGPRRVPNGPTWDRLPVVVRAQAPRQTTFNNQSRIRHREPLATVMGSVNFGISTYEINPGLATTFPWLSAQASGYESYRVNALTVEYRYTTNEFIGKGSIVIAPDYDAADSAPTNFVAAEQMADSIQGAVAKNWNCILRPRGIGILGLKRYTRSSTLASNLDIKTYDIAQIHVCTEGQTDGAEIGRLWLNYDITLSEPQPIDLPNIVSAGAVENVDGADATITNLIGTAIQDSQSNINITHVDNVVTISNLIAGQTYQFYYHATATTITTAPSLTFTSGLTAVNTTEDLLTLNGGTVKAYAYKCATAGQSVCTLTLGGISVLTLPTRTVFAVYSAITY